MGDSNFLDDLEGLGDDSDDDNNKGEEGEEDEFGDGGNRKGPAGAALRGGVKAEDLDSLDDSSGEEMEEGGGDGAAAPGKRKKEEGREEVRVLGILYWIWSGRVCVYT